MRKSFLSALFISAATLVTSCGETRQITSGNETTATASEQQELPVFTGNIQVSEAEVASTLEYLSSDELEGRMTGTEGIEKAAVFIENKLREIGLDPYFETYRDSFEVKGRTGYNLVAVKEGTDPALKDQFIIVGAHYDHTGTGKPVDGDTIANGANDNASGTTAVLELARQFEDLETRRSIIFTLYSAEEMGLVGSRHLAKRLKEKELDLYAMLSIEMIGIPMENKDYMAYVTGYEISNLAEKFNEYAGERVLGFLPQAKEYNLFRRSDNYPFFQEFGVPAQTLSTFDFTNYDYYHHVDDEFSEMNIPHMVNLIEAFVPGIWGMANSQAREIKMTNE